MGIHVCQSHDINLLLEAVMRQLNQPATNVLEIFQTQSFIVPNKSVEKWLTQQIAERTGVTANYEYFTNISSFQWKAYQKVVEDKDKVSKALMPRIIIKWRVYEAIRPYIMAASHTLSDDAPLYPIVSRIYDSASDISDQDEALNKRSGMLYWVADQVSRVFTNYMTFRSACDRHQGACGCNTNWLQGWSQDKPANVEGWFNGDEDDVTRLQQAVNLERWQRWLWFTLFAEEYQRFQEVDSDFWKAVQGVETRRNALASLPRQLIVFTVLELPPGQLNFLRKLGEHTEVMVYHYNPSQEYWADAVDSRWKKQYDLNIKQRFIEQSEAAGKPVGDAELKKFFEDFSLSFNAQARESRHPLLTRLGKQARDNFSLLASLSSGEEGEWFDLFFANHSDTLLGKLQSDIFHLLEPEQGAYVLKPDDQSIQINVCHSSVRQLEVLKEKIIHWLSQAPEDAPRKLDDILVMVPNIKTMEPAIRSVFTPYSKGTDKDIYLPIKVTGIAQTPVINAWASVMGRFQLLAGRFQYAEFADWLSLPATQNLYGIEYAEVERMLELLKEAKFVRGFDRTHLEKYLSETDRDHRFSFEYALNRLSLGVFVDEHKSFDGVLSADFVQVEDFELIGKLTQIFNDLNDRRDWLVVTELRQADKWFELLLSEIKLYQDYGELNLNVVADVIYGLLRPLSMSVYYDFTAKRSVASMVGLKLPLRYILDEVEHGIQSQLEAAEPSGHITFCQIGYIRPLPYKLVVCLGLDGGAYPTYQNANSFDLMAFLRPVLGDRSRLDDDQGAFLDALILARDTFWVFYNGFDLDGGQVRQPSSVVQDLIDHIGFMVEDQHRDEGSGFVDISGIEVPQNIQSVYQIHPLHPFDAGSFAPERNRLKTHWYFVADKIQASDHQSPAWVDVPYLYNRPKVSQVAKHWISMMTFPARLYLHSLSIKNIAPEDMVPDNEPLVLGGLDRYAVREYLQSHEQIEPEQIDHLLPAGKLKESAWEFSQFQDQSAKARLSMVADKPTGVQSVRLMLDQDIELVASVPKDQQTRAWVVSSPSSAYGEHRAKAWLEYLMWLAYLDLGDEGDDRAMIVVFSNQTIISTGVSSNRAKVMLSSWIEAWRYGQSQPLVLPAKLLLTPLEKGKKLAWIEVEGHKPTLDMEPLLKIWNETFSFSPDFPLSENRANKKHRDWQYILSNQNGSEILAQCCKQFAYDLYQPIYQHQEEFNEFAHSELLRTEGESAIG